MAKIFRIEFSKRCLSFWGTGRNVPHRILKNSLAEEVGADSADGTAGEDTSETTSDEGPDGLERGFEHAAPIDVQFHLFVPFLGLIYFVGLDWGIRKRLFAFEERKQLIENNFFGVWANSPTFNKAAQLRGYKISCFYKLFKLFPIPHAGIVLFNCQRSIPRRVWGGLNSGLNHMPPISIARLRDK